MGVSGLEQGWNSANNPVKASSPISELVYIGANVMLVVITEPARGERISNAPSRANAGHRRSRNKDCTPRCITREASTSFQRQGQRMDKLCYLRGDPGES